MKAHGSFHGIYSRKLQLLDGSNGSLRFHFYRQRKLTCTSTEASTNFHGSKSTCIEASTNFHGSKSASTNFHGYFHGSKYISTVFHGSFHGNKLTSMEADLFPWNCPRTLVETSMEVDRVELGGPL